MIERIIATFTFFVLVATTIVLMGLAFTARLR